jgi:hypothetical protein
VNNHLGITAGAEFMAKRGKLGHQWLKIVDFTIINDANRPILVEERLVPGRKINDRQTSVAETDTRLDVVAVAVRSTMTDYLGHAPQQGSIDLVSPAIVKDTRYAAHLLRP